MYLGILQHYQESWVFQEKPTQQEHLQNE
jgi:hypothetical protein